MRSLISSGQSRRPEPPAMFPTGGSVRHMLRVPEPAAPDHAGDPFSLLNPAVLVKLRLRFAIELDALDTGLPLAVAEIIDDRIHGAGIAVPAPADPRDTDEDLGLVRLLDVTHRRPVYVAVGSDVEILALQFLRDLRFGQAGGESIFVADIIGCPMKDPKIMPQLRGIGHGERALPQPFHLLLSHSSPRHAGHPEHPFLMR